MVGPANGVGAGTGTMTLPPPNTGTGTRLPTGAIRLGNVIYTASQILQSIQSRAERAQVDDAMSRFRLSPNEARDVLAARAYVWSRNMLPMTAMGRDVPFTGALNDAVAMAVMRHELMNPGTAGLASRGDPAAMRAIAGVVEVITVSESRARPPGVAVELQTTSATSRAALALLRGDGMQAHHLVPAEVWGELGRLTQLAQGAGWSPDSAINLIALPATTATQVRLAAVGQNLPVHNGGHPDYNTAVELDVRAGIALFGTDGLITAVEARTILESVSAKYRAEILAGNWHPRIH